MAAQSFSFAAFQPSSSSPSSSSSSRDSVKTIEWSIRRRQHEERLQSQRDARRQMAIHARTLVQRGIAVDTSPPATATAPTTTVADASAITSPVSSTSSSDDGSTAIDERPDDDSNNDSKRTDTPSSSSSTDSSASHGVRWRESHASRLARQYYARQLMLPSWLSYVPDDLYDNWYVVPRPEGIRCLVISARAQTVSRKRNGGVLHRFQSQLPDGSKSTRASDHYCLLDCIWNATTATYYVLDIMCWKGQQCYDLDTECRYFWLRSKLADIACSTRTTSNHHPFQPLSFTPANMDGIKMAYGSHNDNRHGFPQDGILFYNRRSYYELGSTPLVLLWKDKVCSPFPVDTSADATIENKQVVTLSMHPSDRSVRALDGEWIATLPLDFCTKTKCSDGQLLRFTIDAIDFDQLEPRISGLTYVGHASHARVVADTMSKIIYQQEARHNRLLTIEHIMTRCQESAAAASSSSSSLTFGAASLSSLTQMTTTNDDDNDHKRASSSATASSSRAYAVSHLNPHDVPSIPSSAAVPIATTSSSSSSHGSNGRRGRGNRSRRQPAAKVTSSMTTSDDTSSSSSSARVERWQLRRDAESEWRAQLATARSTANNDGTNDDNDTNGAHQWTQTNTSLWPSSDEHSNDNPSAASWPSSNGSTSSWPSPSSDVQPSFGGASTTPSSSFAAQAPLFGSRANMTSLTTLSAAASPFAAAVTTATSASPSPPAAPTAFANWR